MECVIPTEAWLSAHMGVQSIEETRGQLEHVLSSSERSWYFHTWWVTVNLWAYFMERKAAFLKFQCMEVSRRDVPKWRGGNVKPKVKKRTLLELSILCPSILQNPIEISFHQLYYSHFPLFHGSSTKWMNLVQTTSKGFPTTYWEGFSSWPLRDRL